MNLPENILSAMEILKSAGFESYVVGGCVRDAMMGIKPHDYDLTTSAMPGEMLEVFKNFRIIETGLKHGTVTVVIDGENIEITTFRIDGEYTDNRHPDSVEFTVNLAEDLSRRDFTVNAMAYNPDSGLVDLFGGMKDIESRIIRCVGDADLRFNEDGLRLLRALRFSSQLGFSVSEETSESIFRNKGLLKNISRERIYAEFTKLLCGKNPSSVIDTYRDVLKEFVEFDGDMSGISEGSPNRLVRYAYFLRNTEKPSSELAGLRAEKDTIRTVSDLCARINECFEDEISLKYLLRDRGENFAYLLCELKEMCGENCEKIRKTVSSLHGSCVSLKQLAVSGGDLEKIGVKPGREMGKILDKLLDCVIRETVPNEKQKLLEFAKSLLDNLSCP